jgi:hypothetical protein
MKDLEVDELNLQPFPRPQEEGHRHHYHHQTCDVCSHWQETLHLPKL